MCCILHLLLNINGCDWIIQMKSLLQSIVDVGSGFILAIMIQIIVFPMFGFLPTIIENLQIAIIFTCVSIIRSWMWRLYFK